MFFIGILTDKNSENNIKNIMERKVNENKLIFFNKDNLRNFKNVKFDSIIINNNINDEYDLNKILEKSKYIVCNSDIDYKSSKIKELSCNAITYGYNSKATVTISSATEENYLIFVQQNICGYSGIKGMQEIKFERNNLNINAYDGMIMTIIDLIYNKEN